MRRLQLVFLFGLFFTHLWGQGNDYHVVGKVGAQFVGRYAYLYLQQRGITICKPIKDFRFEFAIKKLSDFETGVLFFGNDTTRKFSDTNISRKMGIKETKIFVLEDSVGLDISYEAAEAKVTGGILNKDFIDMFEAIKKRNYLNFFSTHPNSLVSLVFLKSLIQFQKGSILEGILDCSLYYQKLSPALKESPEGREILNSIK